MKLGVWPPSACLTGGRFSKMGLGATGGFPSMFRPLLPLQSCQMNTGAPNLWVSVLHHSGELHHSWGEKLYVKKKKKRKDGKNQEEGLQGLALGVWVSTGSCGRSQTLGQCWQCRAR